MRLNNNIQPPALLSEVQLYSISKAMLAEEYLQLIMSFKQFSSKLSELELRICRAKINHSEWDELDLLVTLVESYEIKHYPIAPLDRFEAIIFAWSRWV